MLWNLTLLAGMAVSVVLVCCLLVMAVKTAAMLARELVVALWDLTTEVARSAAFYGGSLIEQKFIDLSYDFEVWLHDREAARRSKQDEETWNDYRSRAREEPPPVAPSSEGDREKACKILELSDGFSEADLKARHREMITRTHPDQGGSNWMAQNVNWAFDILKGTGQ